MLYADRPAPPNDEQSYLKWLFLPKQRVHTVENGQMDTFNDFLKAFNGLSIKSGWCRIVDRPTQLICIWISIFCWHTNRKDIAGQSARCFERLLQHTHSQEARWPLALSSLQCRKRADTTATSLSPLTTMIEAAEGARELHINLDRNVSLSVNNLCRWQRNDLTVSTFLNIHNLAPLYTSVKLVFTF